MRLELYGLIAAICPGRHSDTQDWYAYRARDALMGDDEVIVYLKALHSAGYHVLARNRAKTWCIDPEAVLKELDELQQTHAPTLTLIVSTDVNDEESADGVDCDSGSAVR